MQGGKVYLLSLDGAKKLQFNREGESLTMLIDLFNFYKCVKFFTPYCRISSGNCHILSSQTLVTPSNKIIVNYSIRLSFFHTIRPFFL